MAGASPCPLPTTANTAYSDKRSLFSLSRSPLVGSPCLSVILIAGLDPFSAAVVPKLFPTSPSASLG
jgi:hypothetical protein